MAFGAAFGALKIAGGDSQNTTKSSVRVTRISNEIQCLGMASLAVQLSVKKLSVCLQIRLYGSIKGSLGLHNKVASFPNGAFAPLALAYPCGVFSNRPVGISRCHT